VTTLRSTKTLATGAAMAAVLLLSACAPDAAAPASGTASESAMPSTVNDTDLHFLAMMTPHHEQAVQMSDIVLAAGGVSKETRDIAERIRSGQQDEIEMIVHHEGAIAMTQDQIDNGGYAELRALAQQMIDVQTAEVVEMNQRLGS
jgi:uncharacterized protein (DUF305 family)